MRATARFLLLFACTAFVLPAGAVDPLGDDAASGADAGDHRFQATPIAPGSYEGRLTAGVDVHDHYAFEATAGQLLELRYDPAGVERIRAWLYAPDGSMFDAAKDVVAYGELDFLIDQNGTWGLHFELYTRGPVVPYTFTLGLRTGHALFGSLDVTAATAEARFDTRGDIFAFIRGSGVPQALTDPYAYVNFIDYSLGNDAGRVHRMGSFHGVSDSVSDTPVTEVVGAVDEVPHLVSEVRGDQWIQSTLLAHNVSGYVRLTSMMVHIDGRFDYAFWSTEPFVAKVGAAEERIVWASEEDPKDVDTPVLAVSPDRSFSFNATERFIGYFRPGVANASAEGPARGYNITSFGLSFYWPDAGEWTLHIPETTRSAHHTERLQFYGIAVPDLDVAPDPWRRSPR